VIKRARTNEEYIYLTESPIGLVRGICTGCKIYLALAGIGYFLWNCYRLTQGVF
jgi:hypothetical protein